jgi:hypothetical protein
MYRKVVGERVDDVLDGNLIMVWSASEDTVAEKQISTQRMELWGRRMKRWTKAHGYRCGFQVSTVKNKARYSS